VDAEPRYRLIVRSQRCATPALARLRRLLKMMARGYGFICEEATELPPEPAAKPSTNKENR
jgi:hypothetical protein